MTDKLTRLRELAEAATPGPYRYRAKSNALYTLPPSGTEYTYGKYVLAFGSDENYSDEQWALIGLLTACDPQTILALLAVASAAREHNAACIAMCQSRRDGTHGECYSGMCKNYQRMGKSCHDCPRDNLIAEDALRGVE